MSSLPVLAKLFFKVTCSPPPHQHGRFGLSAQPDVRQVVLDPSHRFVRAFGVFSPWRSITAFARSCMLLCFRVLVLASDGLWDVVSADTACRVALDARATGR